MKQEIKKIENPKKKSKKRKVIISVVAIVLVIALAVSGAFIYKSKTNTQTYSFVRTTTLSKGTLDNTVTTTGTVSSSDVYDVTTTLEYKVKSVSVAVGDEVKAGDTIVTLDTTNLEKQIATAKKNIAKQVKSAKLSYNNAKQSYSDAKSDYESAKKVLSTAKSSLKSAKNSTTSSSDLKGDNTSDYEKAEEEYQNAKTALKQAKSSLTQAKSQLAQAKDELTNASDDSELEELEDNLKACTLTSEIDGTVTSLNAKVGATCKDTVAEIQNMSSLQVDITIEEADINNVKLGMNCNITTDADDNTYTGTLTQIDPIASNDGSFGATVTVQSSDTALKIGMNASVEIVISSSDNVYQVPIDAVGSDDTGSFVYRKTGGSGVDMTFEKVYVTTGDENDYYIEINSDDLNDGDVIRSSSDLSQGIETQSESSSNDKKGFSLFGSFGAGDSQNAGQMNGGTPPQMPNDNGSNNSASRPSGGPSNE